MRHERHVVAVALAAGAKKAEMPTTAETVAEFDRWLFSTPAVGDTGTRELRRLMGLD